MRVVFFNKPAETIGQYVRKGQQLYVEGRLQTRKWQDKDGVEKYSTDIISDNFTFVGSKSDSVDNPAPQKNQENSDFSNQDIIKDEKGIQTKSNTTPMRSHVSTSRE